MEICYYFQIMYSNDFWGQIFFFFFLTSLDLRFIVQRDFRCRFHGGSEVGKMERLNRNVKCTVPVFSIDRHRPIWWIQLDTTAITMFALSSSSNMAPPSASGGYMGGEGGSPTPLGPCFLIIKVNEL